MNTERMLRVGDVSDNGQVCIIDEDRLCYLVKSENRGAVGVRTISKALLNEFIAFFHEHPDANPNSARDTLSGKSNIDKFEYGYASTLSVMAKMVIEYADSMPVIIEKNQQTQKNSSKSSMEHLAQANLTPSNEM